jgi:hypothetical protein
VENETSFSIDIPSPHYGELVFIGMIITRIIKPCVGIWRGDESSAAGVGVKTDSS